MKADEIAIIGMAGRFPGARDVKEYWKNLVEGVDSSRTVTAGIPDFDAGFFGFGAEQATYTDPQHRMFLEVAWSAFEDSGYLPTEVDLSIGVFASTSLSLYLLMQIRSGAQPLPPHQSPDHMPALVAYRLGARGPTMAVQSACSGSLVAVCVAAQSLLDYRCDIAIAGGSRVHLPESGDGEGLAAPDGVVRAFDAGARGTAFGSGAGAVVMRRLTDALEAGDHIHAVLRGWAVTNDGADRAGYSVPGVNGQAGAVEEALAVADLCAEDIGFIEAHGSGTLLGDAIEVTSLRRVFNNKVGRRVFLGSGKANIGHLDAASGIAGLIKAIMTVKYGTIPGNLHFTTPNPQVDFGPLVVPTATVPWPAQDEPGCGRIAGVSSFGMGGTNAHVLVSGTDAVAPRNTDADGEHVLWLSARSPEALKEMAGRLGEHLETVAPPIGDVAFTLATGRARFRFGAAVRCVDLKEAKAGLAAIADGGRGDDAGPDDNPRTGPPGRRVPLPAYPFERQRFWARGVEDPS